MRDNVVFLGVPHESGVGGWLLHFSLSSLTHPDLLQPRAAILSQLRQSLRNNIILLYHAMHYKCGSKRSTEASSISAEKLDVTTRVLQELFAPGMKLDAMLKGVENILLQFPDAEGMGIVCRENASNRVLYKTSCVERGDVQASMPATSGIAYTRSASSSSLSSGTHATALFEKIGSHVIHFLNNSSFNIITSVCCKSPPRTK